MKDPSLARRVVIIVVLALGSIAIHEFGHFVVYKAARVPVHVTLQSVRAVGYVDPVVDLWGKFAGPALSWIAAVGFLAVARRKPGFVWTTASFTNASLRLFPCAMDLLRAFKNAKPFSDEGDIALAISKGAHGRELIVLAALGLSFVLTVLAARHYHFTGKGRLKAVGIYLLSLAVGIGVVLVDELTRR